MTDLSHRTPTQQPSLSSETPEKTNKELQNIGKQPNKQQSKSYIRGYHFLQVANPRVASYVQYIYINRFIFPSLVVWISHL